VQKLTHSIIIIIIIIKNEKDFSDASRKKALQGHLT